MSKHKDLAALIREREEAEDYDLRYRESLYLQSSAKATKQPPKGTKQEDHANSDRSAAK